MSSVETSGTFRSVILKWSTVVESISRGEQSSLRENPWFQGRAKILMAMVAKVGEALRTFLRRFPKMEAASCNALLFVGATVAIADLFLDVLVNRVQNVITSSCVNQAKVFAKETFHDVKPRLEKLDIQSQDLDLTDHQSSSDVERCLRTLNEANPPIERGISKLDRSLVVSSTLRAILGVVGISGILIKGVGWPVVIVCCIPWIILDRVTANCKNLKNHFVTYNETCKEVTNKLKLRKKRMDDGQSTGTQIDDIS